jgi:hypothetical protein
MPLSQGTFASIPKSGSVARLTRSRSAVMQHPSVCHARIVSPFPSNARSPCPSARRTTPARPEKVTGQYNISRKACRADGTAVTATHPRISRLTMKRNNPSTKTPPLLATPHQRRHQHISCRERRPRSRSLSHLSSPNS